ncbi:MAG TPA: AIR synthase family protein [Clostridia bacterium]|nr:AIR synthase family protein [Clostridia bacterium]
MNIGKVPNEELKKIILDKIKHKRDEIILRPQIGEDCSAVDFGENVCVLTTDPITGTAHEIGRLAVQVSCNDIASAGVEPLGLMVTILAPPGTRESELELLMTDLCGTADELNVDIMGGHTEITAAVNRFVVITTAIGKAVKGKMVTTAGAKPGDSIVMTKTAGIEGTAIIASEKEKELEEAFGIEFVNKAKEYIKSISVVKEGKIAGEFGVNAMHDVTEGGLLGAVWEVAEASGLGIRIDKNKIPVAHETKMISDYYKIDPLKLISSGSMVIACSDGEGLVKELAQNGISAAIVGTFEAAQDRLIITDSSEEKIIPPGSDELYKVI